MTKHLRGKLGLVVSPIPDVELLEGTDTTTAYGESRKLKLVWKEKSYREGCTSRGFICPPTIIPKLLHLFSSSKN